VLTEMRQIGLAATEFGPDGFLPATPEGKAQTLADHGLHGLGGFTPVTSAR
jgi:inosose dehydratase